MPFESGDDRVEALGEGRAPQAIQPRLRGDDLDDDQPLPGWLGGDDVNIPDGDRLGHEALSFCHVDRTIIPRFGAAANIRPRGAIDIASQPWYSPATS